MEFELRPVDEIPQYLNVYCGFTKDNHDHLPIIWRYTFRSSYCGWADWGKKYGMVNFYHLYNSYLQSKNYDWFIDEFLRIYYHEFIHLYFKFRLGNIYYKGKIRNLSENEDVIDAIAKELYTSEYCYVKNYWADEIFRDELDG